MPRKLNGNTRVFGPSDAFPHLRYQGSFGLAMETLEGDHHRQHSNFPEVCEIVSAEEYLFCLTRGGICVVYDRDTMTRVGKLCNLQTSVLQAVRSLFFNRCTSCLIVVAVDQTDNFQSMKCYSLPLLLIRRGIFNMAIPILTSENLSYPGFVEFDDVNQKILTLSVPGQGENRSAEYKVWSMADYTMLYMLPSSTTIIAEVKISPGLILVMHTRTRNTIPLKVLDIHTGTVRRELSPLLKQHCRLELVELFNDKLLIKQQNQSLRIIDVRTQACVTVPQFATPSSFIFLYEKNLFLAFHECKLTAWNFNGDIVSSFPELCSPGRNNYNVSITRSQAQLVAVCSTGDQSVQLSLCDTVTGQVLGTLTTETSNAPGMSLCHITSLLFDEDKHVVYAGNTFGHVNIWGVRPHA